MNSTTNHDDEDDGISPERDAEITAMIAAMEAKVEQAKTREEMIEALESFMSPSMAANAVGFMMGEGGGDIIDLADREEDGAE